MAITAEMVKTLREKTGAGMMECKKALTEADGSEEQAIEILRKAGLASAKKREGRIAAEGAVGSYIHMGGKVGVLVEVNCETDFVARGEDFQRFVKDIAMHICASEPQFVTKEEVSADVIEKEKEIARGQALADPKNANKPEQIIEKMIQGRLDKFFTEAVLLEQPFVKDQTVFVNGDQNVEVNGQQTIYAKKSITERVGDDTYIMSILSDGKLILQYLVEATE